MLKDAMLEGLCIVLTLCGNFASVLVYRQLGHIVNDINDGRSPYLKYVRLQHRREDDRSNEEAQHLLLGPFASHDSRPIRWSFGNQPEVSLDAGRSLVSTTAHHILLSDSYDLDN